jgi:transcription initiation factor TFIIB
LGYPIEKLACYIGRKAVELNIVPGRRPVSVAATAVFMAAYASDKQFAKNELSNGTGVANATIRTVYKLMHPRAAELFPENFNFDLTKLPRS